MTIDPIPDLLSELRAGRYGHDLVTLLGGGGQEDSRMRLLRQILGMDEAGEIVTNLVIIGARYVLQVMTEAGTHPQVSAAIERLKRPTPEELENYATSPASLGR